MEYDDEGNAYDELPRSCRGVQFECDARMLTTLIHSFVACSKFTMEEQRFCDRTAWEDSSGYCEYSFDLRVFQAFIWAEVK